MNSTQSIHFKDFDPPSLASIWAPQSIVFLALNILTIGIYGSAETASKQYRVKELKIIQENLLKQALELTHKWNDVEKKLTNLLDQFQNVNDEKKNEIKRELNKLADEKYALEGKSIRVDYKAASSLSEVALGTIAFVGQLFSNIITIGLHGVYQNYSLKNEITVLEAQNAYVKEQCNQQSFERSDRLQKIIDLVGKTIDLNEELQGIAQTDLGEAYLAAQQAKQTIGRLQNEQQKLQKDLGVLRVQKVAAEQGKEAAEKVRDNFSADMDHLRLVNKKLSDQELRARQSLDRTQKDNIAKGAELKNLRAKKDREIGDLQLKVNAARTKADRVHALEKELSKLKDVNKNQSAMQKLQAELGPIDPKYTPRKDAPEIIQGAEGIEDVSETDEDIWSSYAQRYNRHRTAGDVMKAAFSFGFNQLMDMAKQSKIKFSDCIAMQKSPGARALYRFMILDLIKGAKLHKPTCEGFELLINNQEVVMIPSEPEKVMRYKLDSDGKTLKPYVETRFTRRDDFTPTESQLDRTLPYGVDPIGVKRILEQLSVEEEKHLFTLLMGSIIENDNPTYCQTKEFMRNKGAERVELVETAYQLICDMGTAIEKKFGENILIKCWQENVDTLNFNLPFMKPEDEEIDPTKVVDIGLVQDSKAKARVVWELDLDVLGDKRTHDVDPRQSYFSNLIIFAQIKYKTFFDNLKHGILKYEGPKKSFDLLDWKTINRQYHVSHHMIGSNSAGKGGHRCLFSNLLAVLVTTPEDLSDINAVSLRNGMAAYLDKLQAAKIKWNGVKDQLDPHRDAKELEKLADLCKSFDFAIYETHHCTMLTYQAWLRNEYGAIYIDIENLTQLEIQLCAYTMGVKIGVLPIGLKTRAIVDDYGRIVPETEYYGPNTKEFFLIGNTQGSYWGLFPRLNVIDNIELGNDMLGQSEMQSLIELEGYWLDIELHKEDH